MWTLTNTAKPKSNQTSHQASREGHQDPLEVKVDGGAENCVLPLRAYRRMFPNNSAPMVHPILTQSAGPIIPESYTDDILPVHRTLMLK